MKIQTPIYLKYQETEDDAIDMIKRGFDMESLSKFFDDHKETDQLGVKSEDLILFQDIEGNFYVATLWHDPDEPQNFAKMVASIKGAKEKDGYVEFDFRGFVYGSEFEGFIAFKHSAHQPYLYDELGWSAFITLEQNGSIRWICLDTILVPKKYCNILNQIDGSVLQGDNLIEVIHRNRTKNKQNFFPYVMPRIIKHSDDNRNNEVHTKLNTDSRQIGLATLDHGPSYNKMTPQGMPLIGHLLTTGENSFITKTKFHSECNAYAPEPGITKFLGLVAHGSGAQKGQITLMTEISDYRPALILSEDIDVLLSSVFLENTSPSFGLHNIDDGFFIKSTLAKRVWSPQWYQHTALGQTLYITDRLLGDFTWKDDDTFSLDVQSLNIAPHFQSTAIEFSEGIRFIRSLHNNRHRIEGQSDDFGMSCAMRLHLPDTKIESYVDIDDQTGDLTIIPSMVKPRVRGWLHKNPGQELYINDPRHQSGASANFLTANFNQLASLFPVFERYRQLATLHRSLIEARNKGFQLSSGLVTHLKKRKEELIKRCNDKGNMSVVDFRHQIGPSTVNIQDKKHKL